jgi:hypothetical protein
LSTPGRLARDFSIVDEHIEHVIPEIFNSALFFSFVIRLLPEALGTIPESIYKKSLYRTV